MRALVIYCHPREGSFNAAVRDVILDKLRAAGAEIRLTDLYARDFQPVLTPPEWSGYLDCPANQVPVAEDVDNIRWCDTLIFVYPTWWYGLPAMLKGWLDRTLLPDVAFFMPNEGDPGIQRGLTHITRLGVFTTCGASWLLTKIVGSPGRRTLLWGLGLILAPRHKWVFAAHYRMDSSTPVTRARHLTRVAAKMDRLIGRPAPTPVFQTEAAR